jgi:hypothetical protein
MYKVCRYRQIEEAVKGGDSTWAGATPVLRTSRVGPAALVAPAHVPGESQASTVPGLTECRSWPQPRLAGGHR